MRDEGDAHLAAGDRRNHRNFIARDEECPRIAKDMIDRDKRIRWKGLSAG